MMQRNLFHKCSRKCKITLRFPEMLPISPRKSEFARHENEQKVIMWFTCERLVPPGPRHPSILTKRADEKYDHTWVRETLAFWSRLIKRQVWDIHIHVSYSHFDRNWPKGESPGSNKQPCSPPTLSFLVEAGVIITILCFSFLYVANTSDWVSRVGKIKRLRLCKI